MFIFSKLHDWQDNAAVKQVLVFATPFTQESFNEDFAKRVEQYGVEDADDNDIGAVYKLRAVKTYDGRWIPIIRCGASGVFLWEDFATQYTQPESAIKACKAHLRNSIIESLDIGN